jgi:2-oxoisovalerate dehydrogenase E2 component (dihydrolipoyl transacylase)
MMTDKATVEMESPVAGVVSIAGEVGDVVAIGSPLVVIEVEGEARRRAPRKGPHPPGEGLGKGATSTSATATGAEAQTPLSPPSSP